MHTNDPEGKGQVRVPSQREQLRRALEQTTVALRAGPAVGTGFFVAPGLVLTCAHVVAAAAEGARPVQGTWRGDPVELTVEARWYRPEDQEGADLALLRVDGDVATGIACLCGAVEPGDELYAWGYPDGNYRAGDSVTFAVQGPSIRTDGTTLLRVAGARVTGGFSGAPVVNWRTGMVCGLVRLADNTPGSPPLTRLVPASVILETFAETLGEATLGSWMELLDDCQLRAAGSRRPGPRLRDYLAAICADEQPTIAEHTDGTSIPLSEVQQTPQLRVASGSDFDIEAAAGGPNLLVVGEPGAGKSSMLHWLRRRLAERLLAGEDVGGVPVLVSAEALIAPGPSLPARVADAVGRNIGHLLTSPLTAAEFEREAVPGVPWLLLVDGIEEILDSGKRQLVLQTLVAACGRPHLRLLVATRPLPEREAELLRNRKLDEVSLLPFALTQVTGLAEALLGILLATGAGEVRQHAVRLTERIEASQIANLARLPLLATMICIVYAADPDSDIPHSRYQLYARFVERLLDRQRRELKALPRLREIAELFPYGQPAVERLLHDLPTVLTSYAVQARSGKPMPTLYMFARAWVSSLRPPDFSESTWHQTLENLLRQTGLVVGDTFSHATIADFLAASVTAPQPWAPQPSPIRAASMDYVVANRSYLSFIAAGWARHQPEVLRLLCERLAGGRPVHLDFLVTLHEDGVPLPPAIVQRTVRLLETAANNPILEPHVRVTYAALLFRLDPRRSVPRLRILALDPRAAGRTPAFALSPRLHNIDVTDLLLRVDPSGVDAVLRFQVTDPRRPPASRMEAARRWQAIQPELHGVGYTLLIYDGDLPDAVRLDALCELADVHPVGARAAARRLLQQSDLAVDAAMVLLRVWPEIAIAALRAVADDDTAPVADRCRAAERLLEHPETVESARALLAGHALDGTLPADVRWLAIAALTEAGDPDAIPQIRCLAADRAASAAVRLRAVRLLVDLHPGTVADALRSIADLAGVEPGLTVEVFAACAAAASEQCGPAIAVYLTTFARVERDWGRRDDWFGQLAHLLRQVDPVRCAAEMCRIVHEPESSSYRRDAENVWQDIEPAAYSEHLFEVARFKCRAGGVAGEVRDMLGGAAEPGYALLKLSRMNDPRALRLAEKVIEAYADETGHGFTELQLYAAQVIAEHDDCGCDLIATMALDAHRDPQTRIMCVMRLHGYDEARAQELLAVLAHDPAARDAVSSAHLAMLDLTEARALLGERVLARAVTTNTRADAIRTLLQLDPDSVLRLLLQRVDDPDTSERRWAREQLSEALKVLDINVEI